MRKHSLLVASTLALAAATSLLPSLAHAACSEPAGRCGDGKGKDIKYAATQEVLDPAIGFNWTSAPYEVNFVVDVDLRARAAFGFNFAQLVDPVKGNDHQPLWTVNLDKAPLTATWSAETKVISIQRVDGTDETASIDVRYTVRPNAQIGGDYKLHSAATWNQLFTYNYDLTEIFSDTIGNDEFGIDGSGVQTFKPWALAGISPFLVPGGSIEGDDTNSALFNAPWSFGDFENGSLAANGTFGVYVKTDPEFSYKTLSVKYGSTELADDVSVDLPTQAEYGNSVKVPVKVHGGVRIDGTIQAKPFLHLDQVKFPLIGTQTIDYTFETGIDALTKPVAIPDAADGLMEFDFPTSALVEIPIPNVKLGTQSVEFTGTVGTEGNGKVTIKNEGQAPAKLTFEADGDFNISSQSTEISPGSSFDLTVRANPTEAGSVSGGVKIHTNDPDSPLLELGVNGEFTNAPVPPDNGGDDDASGDDDDTNSGKGGGTGAAAEDSGCGCKTAGTPASSPLGVLGGLALGVAALIRRRRKA